MSDALPVLTTCWGLVMALAPLLQIRLIVRDKDASGVSPTWVCILLVGFSLWLVYGVVNHAVPLIIANTVSLTVGLALLTTVTYFRRRNARAVPASREVPSEVVSA